jgi:CBS domain-containing protein
VNAAEIMSKTVVAVTPETPLAQAVRLMIDARVSGVPVIDAEGRAVGMLTEGDLLRRAETGTEGPAPGWFAKLLMPGRLAGRHIQTHSHQVGEVMTLDVVTVEEGAPLEEVRLLMQRHRIKRLPVARDGKVVGVVSRADLARALAQSLFAATETPGDAAIAERIRAELRTQPWSRARGVAIAVENGVVLLDGCVFDPREREAIRVLAENVPGVQSVKNRLI